MRCPRCDIAIPIGGEMCTKCGYNVRTKKTDPNWHPPVPPKPEPPKPVPPKPEPPKPVPPKPEPPKPKPKRRWFRRFCLTLLACIIGRYIGFMAGNLWARIELGDLSFRKESVQETVNPAFDTYTLGVSYAHGRGVPQDYEQALYWYRIAAERGVPFAKSYLPEIEKQAAQASANKNQTGKCSDNAKNR